MSTFQEIIKQTVNTDFKELLLKQDWTELNKKFDFKNWNDLYCPKKYLIFRAFKYFNISETKVCILGQDPYSQSKNAIGIAFCTPKNIKPPKSLQNIYKEIRQSCNIETPNIRKWPLQGVLLLNTALTTEIGKRNAHRNIGWRMITGSVIDQLSDTPTVFLAWGSPAKKLTSRCKNRICTSHPSPLSATKTNTPFLGSGCFTKIKNINW